MTHEKIDQALSYAVARGTFENTVTPERGVSEALILEAEAKLGGRFPPSYRYFLKTYGSGSVNGREFMGLIKDRLESTLEENTVTQTLELRDEDGLPRDLICVEFLDDGAYACLALGDNDSTESPVILWEIGYPEDHTPAVLAASFGEYFYQRIVEICD